jgi:hypothetical protein
MWLKWFPWRYIVRRVARARGFIDPVMVLAQLHRFAQPSEVGAPLELLRAGVVFHARGLMNTGAIQHNLDWVWPYWVERQFDPLDESFIPRAFSITHVNLTHRNWTAVGLPDADHYPLVDPRGLVTPLWDRWSIDAWIVGDEKPILIPSRMAASSQRLELKNDLAVATETAGDGCAIRSRAAVEADDGRLILRTTVEAQADRSAWLAIVLRPYNPEGVSFVHDIALLPDRKGWAVDERHKVRLSEPPERHRLSTYRQGDVFSRLPAGDDRDHITCDVGMATAAAMYEITPSTPRRVEFCVPLAGDAEDDAPSTSTHPARRWPEALAGACQCVLPNERWQFLFDAAVRTLILHSPGDVYPGPYTYKRFWFRDAAFILHALLCAGLKDRVERVLDRFPARQTRAGYFLSQEGEWDSNGAALWILQRYCQLTGQRPKTEWRTAIERGGQWIINKRLSDQMDAAHAGLLPAGFSAEHLGPNDFYYWDDFWSVAGLRAAAELIELDRQDPDPMPSRFRHEADGLLAAVERSLTVTADRRNHPGLPASPYRRMDAGAIGSIAVGYPLQLWPADEPRLLATADFLREHCFVRGGFFQDMIHSGINAYLTLHVAQVLLRAGNRECADLAQSVAQLASPTGQWPEAIHPRTLGGCMGDGQHVWAAAEWLLYLRNAFVLEEQDRLVLGAGIPLDWLQGTEPCSLGPTPTPYGPITVTIRPSHGRVEVDWTGEWRGSPPQIEVRVPGYAPAAADTSRQPLAFYGV